jgi:aminoglycoside phosphotransferase (APT) family kinase protein
VPGAPADPLSLPDTIVDWIEDVAGAPVEHLDRRPGGARKEAWFVDVRGPDGARPLFLRYDRSDPTRTGDPWTLRREAIVYLALQGTEVLAPTVVAVHPTEQAMLSERVTGENWFSRIRDPDEQLSVARDFMTRLAALHSLDPDELELPGFPSTRSVPELVEHELDEWERVIEFRGGNPDPGLRVSMDWLRANIPDYEGPPVLVQGDTGPGNFMYADGKVVAVVDWELAHLGDPMDDIAWLSLRAVQEPFTHFPDRLADYVALTGNAIDEHRVRYYRVMAETKLLVMSHSPGGIRIRRTGGGGGDAGNGLIYGVLHRRLWLEAFADLVGIEEQVAETPPDLEPTEADQLFDNVLGQLRDVVAPRIEDPLALQRTKGVARILKYLAEIQRHGGFYEACELDDVEQALGERPIDVGRARAAMAAAVESGKITDADYLRFLWRRVARDNELLRPASGVMADRHWPPLH